jgi:hypothetical protein
LIAGGHACIATDDGCSPYDVADAYLRDPSSGSYGYAGLMTTPRGLHQATLLPDGTVFISGGDPLGSAEIYTPKWLTPAPTLFQGVIWHADTGKIVSSDNPATGGDVLSMYTTRLVEGGLIPPQVAVGGKPAGLDRAASGPGQRTKAPAEAARRGNQ